jgi:hypothetical protein
LTLIAGAAAPRRAHAVTTTVDGSVGGFYNRNFGNYLGAVAPVQGESVDATLNSGVLNDRLLRYSLGGSLVEARSIGLAHRIHILDGGTRAAILLFPVKWYQLGADFSASRLRLKDGPEYSWSSWSRTWNADLSVRPPNSKIPGLYTRYGDFRYRTTLESSRGEQRKLFTARLDQSFTANTRADATYDLTDIDYLSSSAAYRNHRVLANFFSRPATATAIIVRGTADWYDTRVEGGGEAWSKLLGYQAYVVHDITADDQLNASASTSSQRAYRSYVLTNDVQGVWYHRLSPGLRTKAGGEFGHQATDGTTIGFAYQKFRESALLGADARLPMGALEFSPVYTLTAGAVQVERGGGGSLVRHEAGLPLLFTGLDGMPMWLSAFLNVERDSSSVPVYRRYRALNYRIDVASFTSGGSGGTTRIFLEAQRSRAEEKILGLRTQLDETRAGIQGSTTIYPLYSSFGLGYSWSYDQTLVTEYTVNQIGANWTFWPVAGLLVGNSVNWSRTTFAGEGPVTRTFYQIDAGYRWRALEFTSAFRYDTYDNRANAQWGMYFQVKRYFSYGG